MLGKLRTRLNDAAYRTIYFVLYILLLVVASIPYVAVADIIALLLSVSNVYHAGFIKVTATVTTVAVIVQAILIWTKTRTRVTR